MAKKKAEIKNIGIQVEKPTQSCDDPNCPFHGELGTRGKIFNGVVIKDAMQKTVVVEWQRKKLLPKYERYIQMRTRIKAHNPPCINAQKGDLVKIMETRPLSKEKNFVVIEKSGKDIRFKQKEEGREEGKFKKAEKEATENKQEEKPEDTPKGEEKQADNQEKIQEDNQEAKE